MDDPHDRLVRSFFGMDHHSRAGPGSGAPFFGGRDPFDHPFFRGGGTESVEKDPFGFAERIMNQFGMSMFHDMEDMMRGYGGMKHSHQGPGGGRGRRGWTQDPDDDWNGPIIEELPPSDAEESTTPKQRTSKVSPREEVLRPESRKKDSQKGVHWDSDVDEEVARHGVGKVFGQKKYEASRPQVFFKSFSSVHSATMNPDGTWTEEKVVRDSNGNEERTVRRGDRSGKVRENHFKNAPEDVHERIADTYRPSSSSRDTPAVAGGRSGGWLSKIKSYFNK